VSAAIWRGNAAYVHGAGKRFKIYKINAGPFSDCYHVADAETISDEQVRNGANPRIVGEFATEFEAVNWIMENSC